MSWGNEPTVERQLFTSPEMDHRPRADAVLPGPSLIPEPGAGLGFGDGPPQSAPMFGGQSHFGYASSPVGPEYSSPLGAAIHFQHAGSRPPLPMVEFNPRDWAIHPKAPRIDPFDGKPEHYRLWRSRVQDHLVSGYVPWGRILELAEKERTPLNFQRLRNMKKGRW